jgi:hypothetical protein
MLLTCRWKDLDADLPAQPLAGALAISGLYDLEPLRHTPCVMNDLRLTPTSVARLSPAFFPRPKGGKLFAVVGLEESDEFLRQNALIRDVWGPTAVPVCETLPGANHFNVLNPLADPASRLHALALRLLGLRGLLPVSRIQLVLAIAMYIGSLAWIGLMFAGLLRQMPLRPDTGLMLFAAIITMTFAPKLATLFNVLARRQLRTAFGGTARVLFSAFVEIVLTMLLAPVSAVAISIFLLGLPLGRRVGWTSQQRDAERVPLAVALRCLWPQALVGMVLAGATFWIAPGAFWFGLPIYLGLLLAVPLAMASASPALGRAMARAGICRTPDETWPAAAAADPGTGLFAPGAKAALAANG